MREKPLLQAPLVYPTLLFDALDRDVTVFVLNGKPKAANFALALSNTRPTGTEQMIIFQNRFIKP